MEIYTTYKDRVFRMLLRDRKRLLELYNALNGTNYDNEEDLQVTTLENALFIKMKNDVSFIIDSNMCLYEHQSTYCPNMPLRGFFYFADLYKKHVKNVELSTSKLIKIPTPHYVVFYNGLECKEEEFEQKLSHAFEDAGEGCIELKVRTININYGHNKEFLDRCETLAGYAYFVAKIREKLPEKPDKSELTKAVEEAVEECIREGVLREFLQEQKAEVIAMSIYEYNEEYARKAFYEDGDQAGYSRGRAEGMDIGKEEGIAIGKEEGIAIGKEEGIAIGKEEGIVIGKEEGIVIGKELGIGIGKDIGNAERLIQSVEALMQKLSYDEKEACESIGVTVEEYHRALDMINEK